ncbi:MAG: DUF1002 domain-containing protein [Christensenellaceae bacterium]|jgi:uncharacterized protein YpuA (DUF1002 family)
MKRILILSLAILLVMCLGISPAMAATEGTRVVLGADNTQEQIDTVYSMFEVNRGDVEELTVTNAEERKYLAGLVPDEKIGNVALSCVYIKTRDTDGISIKIHNINWVTEEMYRSALATAGITNAEVSIAAYKPVSGTGALAGIYKAYEEITGVTLSEGAKTVAAEELVVTGELQEVLGDVSSDIINDIKARLEETKTMSDNQITVLINETATKYEVTLTDDQVQQILDLIKKLNASGIDPDTFLKLAEAGESAKGFFEKVGDFFKGIGDFFKNLFGGGK